MENSTENNSKSAAKLRKPATKLRKSIVNILILSSIVAAVALTLLSNKRALQSELSRIGSFESITPVEVYIIESTDNQKLIEGTPIIESGVFEAISEVAVLSESHGYVERVFVKSGDFVKKGDNLAKINVTLLADKMATASQNLENAEKDMVRTQNLYNGEAATKRDLESAALNLLNAQSVINELKKIGQDALVQSPVSGYISSREISVGNLATPGAPLFKIADVDNLVFRVNIGSKNIQDIRKGQKVTLNVDETEHSVLKGVVEEIGLVPNHTGRYPITVNVVNTGLAGDKTVLPGMSGKVHFHKITQGHSEQQKDEQYMIVPVRCIVGSLQDPNVFVIQNDSASLRRVRAKYLNEYSVIITEGLSWGETVVASGQINLEEGSRVKILSKVKL